MTTVVTDHQIITSERTGGVLVHPSLLPEGYQYLCGAGVAYVIADYLGLMDDSIKVLDMLATFGDVMELKGFNIPFV